ARSTRAPRCIAPSYSHGFVCGGSQLLPVQVGLGVGQSLRGLHRLPTLFSVLYPSLVFSGCFPRFMPLAALLGDLFGSRRLSRSSSSRHVTGSPAPSGTIKNLCCATSPPENPTERRWSPSFPGSLRVLKSISPSWTANSGVVSKDTAVAAA